MAKTQAHSCAMRKCAWIIRGSDSWMPKGLVLWALRFWQPWEPSKQRPTLGLLWCHPAPGAGYKPQHCLTYPHTNVPVLCQVCSQRVAQIYGGGGGHTPGVASSWLSAQEPQDSLLCSPGWRGFFDVCLVLISIHPTFGGSLHSSLRPPWGFWLPTFCILPLL